jgi:hypothetical protein
MEQVYTFNTPGVVAQYNSVSGQTQIDVRKGCCYTITLENASSSIEADYKQQTILVKNANIVVSRIS